VSTSVGTSVGSATGSSVGARYDFLGPHNFKPLNHPSFFFIYEKLDASTGASTGARFGLNIDSGMFMELHFFIKFLFSYTSIWIWIFDAATLA